MREMPPEESRFKPGASGNPKGRPKGAVGIKQIVRRLASMPVPLPYDKNKSIPLIDALVLVLKAQVVAGNLRAVAELERIRRLVEPDPDKTLGYFICPKIRNTRDPKERDRLLRRQTRLRASAVSSYLNLPPISTSEPLGGFAGGLPGPVDQPGE
jgi:hypothetical protein